MLEVVIHNRNYYDWRKHIGWNGLTWHLVFMVHVLLKEYNIGTKYDEELLFSNHENNVILSKLKYLVSLKLHLTFTFSSFSNHSIIIGNKITHNLYDLRWGCPSFWLMIQFHWKSFISTEEVLAEKNIAFFAVLVTTICQPRWISRFQNSQNLPFHFLGSQDSHFPESWVPLKV